MSSGKRRQNPNLKRGVPAFSQESGDPRYTQFTDNYWQRGLKRGLDPTGRDAKELVLDYADPVVWNRKAICPNRIKQIGGKPVHRQNCPICHEEEYYTWRQEELDVALRNFDVEESYYMAGRFLRGSLKITFPPGRVPGFYDELIPQSKTTLFSEALYTLDNQEQVFRLRYAPIRIEQMSMAIPRDQWPLDTVPPGDPNDDVVLYTLEGPDEYDVFDTNLVRINSPLPEGFAVVFVYYIRPVFIVIEKEFVGQESFDPFTEEVPEEGFQNELHGYPVSVVAQLDFLVKANKDRKIDEFYNNYDGELFNPDE